MMNLLPFLIKIQGSTNRLKAKKTVAGFTLIELLVAAIMTFLILTPLLGFVVNIMNDDRREGAKATTDEEINAALDYIQDDLSQAIYIYNNTGINSLLAAATPIIPSDADSTPILVFWKRQLVQNGIPAGANTIDDCDPNSNDDAMNLQCDDTHVLSLVAYYLDTSQDANSPFCSDGTPCPSRIKRFEIHDGVKDQSGAYLCGETGLDDCNDSSQERSETFPINLDTTNLTAVTGASAPTFANTTSVLVNYIDATTAGVPAAATCTNVLGIDNTDLQDRKFADANAANTAMLRTTASNSFYACIDSYANVAQVHIRGNALRRIQTDADYDDDKSFYFPTATVQVRGLSQFGED